MTSTPNPLADRPVVPDPVDSRSETVSALERGLSVLRCFAAERPVLGYADIARITGIPRPTVNRLVATLLANGMLKPDPLSDRFTLGPAVLSLAQVFLGSLDVRAVARPPMQAMAEETQASVYLAVRDGLDMVMIEACRPRFSILAPRLDVGSRVPMAVSALGRAYIAALAAEEKNQLLDSLRLLRGPEWASIEPGLTRALDEARRLGYSTSLGEFYREISSVSVPLVGPGGEVMALNCGGAGFVFTEDKLRGEIAPRLRAVAEKVAAEIGGRVPPAQA
ncbi:IclR family transcriptional regulator [Ramlibacter sp. G-1-2-2]|uniref:IclR family transcriptional regulator n=1 Tax=Ramlibacter agri TaxID=2728837 RepID=A0A848H415_9BURK|nr:IclR family transcriptional regulator [Ramlibacter agri]NML44291.1 IclR family transcriptional regulator [Ramlibacter agri]